MTHTYYVEIISNRAGDTYYVGPFASLAEAKDWESELPPMRDWRVGRVLTDAQVGTGDQVLSVCDPTETDLEIAIAVEAALDAACLELARIAISMRADPAGTRSPSAAREAIVRDLVAAVLDAAEEA